MGWGGELLFVSYEVHIFGRGWIRLKLGLFFPGGFLLLGNSAIFFVQEGWLFFFFFLFFSFSFESDV